MSDNQYIVIHLIKTMLLLSVEIEPHLQELPRQT